MTYEVSLAMIQTIKELYKIDLDIKLPNDIYYNGKKIGGVLCETKLQGEKIKHIVIRNWIKY